MPLSDILNLSITVNAAGPTAPGFGVPLFAAYFSTSIYAGRQLPVSQLTDVTNAGFAVTSPVYKGCAAIWAQSPRCPNVIIGRRALEFTQSFTLTCLSAVANDVYSFTIGGAAIAYTVPSSGSPTTSTVATAIAALITTAAPATMSTVAASGAVITFTSTAGSLTDLLNDATHLTYADTTTDPGIATDMVAILAAGNDWYGLLLDSNGTAEIKAAAAWTESNGFLFVCNTTDAACATSSTSDVMSDLKTSAYARTACLYSQTQLLSYSGAAWMGNRFPNPPGSDTWAFKTLKGVPADNLTAAQIHFVENKNGNVYTALAGLNITQFGKTPSGEWIDTTRFIDWLSSTMQISYFGVLANNPKIPFTDSGIDTMRATVMGVLQKGIDAGGLAATPPPVVTFPTAANVDPTNKENRNIPNASFSATLAGAIQSTDLQGSIGS